MKYLIIPFLFIIIPFLSNAQTNPGQQMNEPEYFQNNEENAKNNGALRLAGEHLQKHSQQYYLGLGLIGGGYVLTAAAVSTDNMGLATAGALCAVGGLVLQVISHRHIGKAGQFLKQASYSHNLQIQGSSTGIGLGLAYNF